MGRPKGKNNLTNHKHYYRWRSMVSRCHSQANPSYKYYGARGIYVCEEWRIPRNFLNWCDETFEAGKSLDRKNNDGPYSPENCRWVTNSEQISNSRYTEKRKVCYLRNAVSAREVRTKIYGNPKTRVVKFCSMCKHFLPNQCFTRLKSSPDGLDTRCRECNRQRHILRKKVIEAKK